MRSISTQTQMALYFQCRTQMLDSKEMTSLIYSLISFRRGGGREEGFLFNEMKNENMSQSIDSKKLKLRGKENMFTFQKKKKKNSIIVPWPGFTDDGNCPFLLLSPFSLSLVFFLFLSIPLYLPPCPFLLIYSLNHALVLMGYNTDVSHTKCYSCPAWLDFLPVPGNRAATCKRKVENPYTFFFLIMNFKKAK